MRPDRRLLSPRNRWGPTAVASAGTQILERRRATACTVPGPRVLAVTAARRDSSRCRAAGDQTSQRHSLIDQPSTADPSSWSITPASGVSSWPNTQQEGADGDYHWPSQQRKKLPSYSLTNDVGPDDKLLEDAAADIARYRKKLKASSSHRSSSKRRQDKWLKQLKDLPGWLLYRYYAWRQDGVSDLLMIAGIATSLLIVSALFKHTVIDPTHNAAFQAAATTGVTAAGVASNVGVSTDATAASSSVGVGGSSGSGLATWLGAVATDMYQVLVLAFGENLPNPYEEDYGPAEGLFSVTIALAGLAGFALALALVEQVVLETNMANVKRGSRVYESGHYLVLGWAVSQRDLEVLIKLVGQLCGGAAAGGGATIVVLTQREKLEIEELFRRSMPPSARAGSRLVFRQGSPLLPSDLSNVAASQARATIIISDQSRSRDEADAQSLRCAILLDELDDYKGLRKGRALGHIVVETRTANAVPLLRFSCSKRVIAMPTVQFNASRVARMVKKPFISWLSQRLMAFDSRCGLYIQAAPKLVGQPFRYLPFYYPDAIILGVAHVSTGHITFNPLLDYTLRPDDELVLCKRRLTGPPAPGEQHLPHLPQLLSIPDLERLGKEELKQQERLERELAGKDWRRRLLHRVDTWLQQVQESVVGSSSSQHQQQQALHNVRHSASSLDTAVQSPSLAVQSLGSVASVDDDGEVTEAAAAAAIAGGAHLASDALQPQGQWGQHSTAPPTSAYGRTIRQSNSIQWAAVNPNTAAASTADGGTRGPSPPVFNADGDAATSNGRAAALAAAASCGSSVSASWPGGKRSSSSVSGHCTAYSSAVLSDSEEIGFSTPVPVVAAATSDNSLLTAVLNSAAAGSDSSVDEADGGLDEAGVLMRAGAAAADAGNTLPVAATTVLPVAAVPVAAPMQSSSSSSIGSSSSSSSIGSIGSSVIEYSDVAEWSMLGSTTLDTMDVFSSSSSSTLGSLLVTSYSSVDSLSQPHRSTHDTCTVTQEGSSNNGTNSNSSSNNNGIHSGSSSSGSGASLDDVLQQQRGLAYSSTDENSSSSSSSHSRQVRSGRDSLQQLQVQQQHQVNHKTSKGAAGAATVTASSAAGADNDMHSLYSSFNYVPREYLAADSSPQAVLVAGWSECGFMAELLHAFDSGSSCLPAGSEIVFINSHPPDTTLGALLRGKTLSNVKVSHVQADPLQRHQLAALPLSRFRAAVVLADERWIDPDMDDSNGIDSIDQPSLLRQDALMVMVQLNIRKLLEDLCLPPINIICQKVGTQGLTRFEDRRRLPLGISVNFNSNSAKLLTQVAMNPLSMLVITGLGGRADLTIVDSSEYCGRGEAMSFWRVLLRAQAAGDVLLGYYVLPSAIDQPIESTINPQGLATRSKQRVWNTGDGRLKFMIIRDKATVA